MTRSLRSHTATCLLLTGLICSAIAQTVDPIVIKGSKFFYKTNGTEFYIKGVAYQQNPVDDPSGSSSNGYVDSLADPTACRRDIPYLTRLSTNTIRVYAVDPTKNHDDCMNMLAAAGIYVIADLGSPDMSINSNTPLWDTALYSRYTSVVDALQGYSNILGFFAGNEIVSQPNQTIAAPFAKAAVRDTKAYIKSKGYRDIGVGYATSDNQYIRVALADYMNCGSDQANAVDFWGYNVYSWCGKSNFQDSGYAERTKEFSSYSVPVFFAEYGCNTDGTRIFDETPVLYGPQMNNVFSGGIVYLYFQEANNYGLVSVSGNSVSTLPDFPNLSSQIKTVSPTGVQITAYTPSNSPQACPTNVANFSADVRNLPPSPNTDLCSCMYSSLGCVVAGSVPSSSYQDLFSYVCSQNGGLCDGINANGTTGSYGPFGMCNAQQKLGYVLNQYFQSAGGGASACAFSGSAVTQAAASATGDCSSRLAVASASVSSGAGGSSGGAATSTGAAAISFVGGYDLGRAWVVVLGCVALISGTGMIVL